MTWGATERKAYAIKKQREERARRRKGELTPAPQRKAVTGHRLHPDNHRCGPYDLVAYRAEFGIGRSCIECGRRWYPNKKGFLVVWPVTAAMPAASESTRTPQKREQGQTGAMPPAHLVGADRGAWWSRHGELRKAIKERAREEAKSKAA